MAVSENENVVERHGCLVCGRIFNLLVIYTPAGRLVDWVVTDPGGQRVPGERQPLVACDTHPAAKIEAAHKKWRARMSKAVEAEQEEA